MIILILLTLRQAYYKGFLYGGVTKAGFCKKKYKKIPFFIPDPGDQKGELEGSGQGQEGDQEVIVQGVNGVYDQKQVWRNY